MATFRVGYIARHNHPVIDTIPMQKIVNGRTVTFTHITIDSDATLELDALLYLPRLSTEELIAIWKKFSVPWVHCCSSGVDSLMPFIRAKNLDKDDSFKLSNGKYAFTNGVVEFCIAAMFHFNKQIPRLMENKKNKTWDRFTMSPMHKRKVTFVGFGDIAQKVAKILQYSFEVEVNVLKRSKCEVQDFEELNVNSVFSFGDENQLNVFKEADFVICTLPGTPETLNFIDVQVFEAMKCSAVFISLGRGTVVSESALTNALCSSQISGAALDVFHLEPLPQDSPLWKLPNLLISPHNAASTNRFSSGFQVFLKNLESYLNDGTLITEVDKSLGY